MEPAQRPDDVDLDQAWQERSTRFRVGGEQVTVLVRVDPARREGLLRTALAVREESDDGGLLRLELTFQDRRHAEWAVWQLGVDLEVLDPTWLRTAVRDRALAIAARYGAAP
jgi:predicted DNA-binding transcriptional regulator YafY